MHTPQRRPYFYQNFTLKYRSAFAAAAVILLSIIVVLSLGQPRSGITVGNADKLAHAFAYFSLGLMVLPALGKMRAIFVWVLLTAFGAGMEVMQGAMRSGRHGDMLDAIANSSGVVAALVFWLGISYFVGKPRQ